MSELDPSNPGLRFMRLPEVLALTSLTENTLYRFIRAGKFPKPAKLSRRLVVWRAGEVIAWMASQPEATYLPPVEKQAA